MAETGVVGARSLFIRRWGEMAARWGISRTMAEIHALLFLSTEPLCTDDVMARLEVSRGSASTNLRQLVEWGLIQRVHHRGDRKEYFDAERDVWQMFETISRERRRREVQPIVETIERCMGMIDEELGTSSPVDAAEAEAYRKRFADILDFCELLNTLSNLMARMGTSGIRPLGKQLSALFES